MLDVVMDSIRNYWSQILGIATAIAFFSEKLFSYLKDRRMEQKVYRKVLASFLRLYNSYINYTIIYSEELQLSGVEKDLYHAAVKKIDIFPDELQRFKQTLDKESDILPNIYVFMHSITTLLDRFVTADAILNESPEIRDNASAIFMAKCAQAAAFSPVLDGLFELTLERLTKEASVGKKDMKELLGVTRAEITKTSLVVQREILERYKQSVQRQNDASI